MNSVATVMFMMFFIVTYSIYTYKCILSVCKHLEYLSQCCPDFGCSEERSMTAGLVGANVKHKRWTEFP